MKKHFIKKIFKTKDGDYSEKQFYLENKKGKFEVYNIIREETRKDRKRVIACGLYQIPSGGIWALLVGETRFYFSDTGKRYYKKTIIY